MLRLFHTPTFHPLFLNVGSLHFYSRPLTLALHIDVSLVPDMRDASGKRGYYKPIIFPNEFWHLRSHYIEINETTPSLPLQITFQPMSWMKFQLFASMTHGFKEAAKQQGKASGAELDEIKRMLLETNPWFLGLTGLVSVLHIMYVGLIRTLSLDANCRN